MEYLQSLWSRLGSIQFADVFDILIVAFLIYKIIPIFRTTNSMRIARVVVVILVVLSAPTFQAKATKLWKQLFGKKTVKEAA